MSKMGKMTEIQKKNRSRQQKEKKNRPVQIKLDRSVHLNRFSSYNPPFLRSPSFFLPDTLKPSNSLNEPRKPSQPPSPISLFSPSTSSSLFLLQHITPTPRNPQPTESPKPETIPNPRFYFPSSKYHPTSVHSRCSWARTHLCWLHRHQPQHHKSTVKL